MKKIYVLATAAIVALASCTKTEVVSNQEPQEIGFRQFTGSMTKTDPTDLASYATTMGVFAYHKLDETTTLYISNGQFKQTSTTGVWGGYPTHYYWPLQGTLDFTVYAPYLASGATYDNDGAKLSVAIDDNSSEQVDYLYGKGQYKNQTKPATGGVPVVLKHALSKVTINMYASDDDIFKVSSIRLKDTYQSGSYVVTYSADDDNTSIISPTESSIKADMEYKTGESDWQLKKDDLSTNTNSKLVVPSAQTSIVITYKMAGSDTPLTASTTLSGNWETGKHYTYNITLGANEILLTPSVEDWPTEISSSYSI